jgi:hypothetical protein
VNLGAGGAILLRLTMVAAVPDGRRRLGLTVEVLCLLPLLTSPPASPLHSTAQHRAQVQHCWVISHLSASMLSAAFIRGRRLKSGVQGLGGGGRMHKGPWLCCSAMIY